MFLPYPTLILFFVLGILILIRFTQVIFYQIINYVNFKLIEEHNRESCSTINNIL